MSTNKFKTIKPDHFQDRGFGMRIKFSKDENGTLTGETTDSRFKATGKDEAEIIRAINSSMYSKIRNNTL
jgi:hypothetical protein